MPRPAQHQQRATSLPHQFLEPLERLPREKGRIDIPKDHEVIGKGLFRILRKLRDVFGRVLCQFGLGAGGDEGGVDPRVTLQHGAQVAILPAGAALDAQHVDFLVDHPDAALHPVVRRRGLVGKRLDHDLDANRSLLGDIDVEKHLLELQAAFERDLLPGHPTTIEQHRQVRHALFIALRLDLDADRHLVAGEGDFLHDDIADRDIIGIGNANRHGIDRNPADTQVVRRFLDAARGGIQPVGKHHDARKGCAALGSCHRFQRGRDRGSRCVGLQRRERCRATVLAITELAQVLAEGMVADIEVLAECLEHGLR